MSTAFRVWGLRGNLKSDVLKRAQVLKNGFNKFNQSQVIKILHCCTLHVKGANGEKECSTTFVLEVIWDTVKAFLDK